MPKEVILTIDIVPEITTYPNQKAILKAEKLSVAEHDSEYI